MSDHLCTTANGYKVFVDFENSHFATHLSESPNLKSLVIDVLQKYKINKDKVRFETNLNRVVGKSLLVPTRETDEIVYAKRPHRNSYMRYVKNKTPIPTTYVTIDLVKTGDRTCKIGTAYVGRATPFMPGEEDANSESLIFWNNHAIIWGTQEIIPGTETTQSPW